MHKTQHSTHSLFRKEKGQSLVEVALFLPLFLILVAGVVEVSQLLIMNNRVSTAARAAARFGANGGQDDGMTRVALNTVTQTMPLESSRWDMWSIRGLVNENGTGFEEWEFTHIYGNENTRSFSEVDEAAIRQEVLDDLQRDSDGQEVQALAANIQFAGTLALFDVESILGLDSVVGEAFTVRDLTVMRTFPTSDTTNGCDAFPIAVEEGIRSLDDNNEGNASFPTDFGYPTSNEPTIDDFPGHVSDIPLLDAKEGYLYFIQNGDGQGNFGWLAWNQYNNNSAGNLGSSLSWPGNSNNYVLTGSGNWPQELEDIYGTSSPVVGFIEAGDPTDNSMHIGDWVAGGPGSVTSIQSGGDNPLEAHVDRGRALRLIVWREGETTGSGNNKAYKIVGFVVMRLHGYSLSQGNQGGVSGSWILAEFISFDETCGQVEEGFGN